MNRSGGYTDIQSITEREKKRIPNRLQWALSLKSDHPHVVTREFQFYHIYTYDFQSIFI